MKMNIAICVKSVPDPELYSSITLDPVTKTLKREGVNAVVNPADKHALELGIQLKEQYGANVTLISMGPPDAQKQLREALSYGADAAVLLSDRKFGGADSLATSYILAQGLKKAGRFDLILAGNESADGATTHVPSQLGEWLGLPHVMEVVECRMTEDSTAIVRKKADGKYYEFEVRLPAVIAVAKEINKVRIPKIKDIFAAKKKPLDIYTAEDFEDLDFKYVGLKGSPTQNGELHEVSYGRQAIQIDGSADEIAAEILNVIGPMIDR